MNIPASNFFSEVLGRKEWVFAYDPLRPLAELVGDYILSQKHVLGDPAMTWSEDNSLLAVTYYRLSERHHSIEQFVAVLQNLSAEKGMESFYMSPYETMSAGRKRIYTVPVECAPQREGNVLSRQELLEIQVTYHWRAGQQR